MTWHIKIDGDGNAVGHVDLPNSANPLTSAKGDKDWFNPATLTDASPNAYQDKSGPVYDIENGTITYSIAYKSLADCKAVKLTELAAYRYEQETGGLTVSGVPVATDRDWETIE